MSLSSDRPESTASGRQEGTNNTKESECQFTFDPSSETLEYLNNIYKKDEDNFYLAKIGAFFSVNIFTVTAASLYFSKYFECISTADKFNMNLFLALSSFGAHYSIKKLHNGARR
jgi:hypothetical protein